MIINPYRFSSAATDPNFSSVILLLHCDGTNGSTTFTDNSSAARTVTANGGAAVSTAEKYFGTGSAYLDGSGDYLSLSDNDAWHMTGDFTVECFIRPSNTSGFKDIIGQRTGNGSCPFVISQNGSALQAYISFNNLSWAAAPAISGGSLSANTWYYVALVRSGSSFKLYLDGSQIGSTFTASDSFTNAASNLNIGGQNAAYQFNGYIDELRWTTVARTISSTPTSAFPNS